MRSLATVLVCASVCAGAAAALADTGVNPWAAVVAPTTGKAQSIGSYRAGCVSGAAALPLRGKGYRVMNAERKRHFAHPAMVEFVQALARAARRGKLGLLGVGDLGQPRGGPAPNGHASHQTGLDADLWYRVRKGRALPMVDVQANRLTKHWSGRIARLLRAAASDERVDRIFVHPVIKRALCERTRGQRAWLRKVRPWWGHHHHFHVRLACPADSPACEGQDPIPDGDGCEGLDWWFRKDAGSERSDTRDKYRERVRSIPALPAACAPLLD